MALQYSRLEFTVGKSDPLSHVQTMIKKSKIDLIDYGQADSRFSGLHAQTERPHSMCVTVTLHNNMQNYNMGSISQLLQMHMHNVCTHLDS